MKKSGGRLFSVLFGGVFAAVGVGVLAWLLWTLFRIGMAQSWLETPAQILEANLAGGDDDTSRAEARYRYTFAGHEYEGTTVSFYSGADNIGSFQRDTHAELSRHVVRAASDAVEADPRRGPPSFRCFVNPHDPEEAVLYRSVRWPMVFFQLAFGLVFGGFGCGVMFGSRIAARLGRKKSQLALQFPGEPWKWREDWARGVIRPDRTAAWALLVFAVFWNLIAFPVGLLALPQARQGNNGAWLALLFPGVGLALAYGGLRSWLRMRRFRGATLQLATVPGVLGGRLAGAIQLPVKLRPAAGFRVTLKCVRSVTTGRGEDRSTREVLEWEDSKVIASDATRDLVQTVIPVLFAIPFGQPATAPDATAPIAWRVELVAKLDGPDVRLQFAVPVFRTAESSAGFELDDSPIRSFLAPVDHRAELAEGRVRVESQARGTTFVFPPARYPAAATALTLFVLIWTGVVVGMLVARAHGNGPPLLFPIVFGLIDLPLLYAVCDSWFGRCRIDVERDTLRWRRSLLGMGRTRSLSFSEIRDLQPVPGVQQNTTQYYAVAVRDQAGRQTKISRDFAMKSGAEALIAEIARARGAT